MQKSFLKSLLISATTALAVLLSPNALAQLVSSGLTGTVTSADGKAVSGITVTAVHTPTNATFNAVTNEAGRFNFRGLPVGGPYTVSAKSDAGEAGVSGITAELGNDVAVNLTLKSEVLQLEKLVVGGERNDLDASLTGAGMTLDSARLAAKPSAERSFADLISATPMVTLRSLSSANDREEAHITAVGQNNRFNSIMIDGSRANDVFGLNGTGIAAFFNPLSVDTLEQLSVQISPYDVSLSGFTGATINAVTKSGTNEFHGSAYYYFRGDHLAGLQLQGPNANELTLTGTKVVPKLQRTTWGGTFGGPIIRNKLFFFLNYENYESISNGRQLRFTPATGVESQILARLKQYSSTIPWGDPVTQATSNTQTDKKILAKVDWQINSDHRLSVRYSKTDGRVPQFGNLGGTLTINGVSSGGNSATPTGHFYDQTRVGESYAAQLFSQWTPDFKTEIKFSRTTDDQLTPTYSTAPLVLIAGLTGTDPSTGGAAAGAYIAGTEQFRHGNVINVVNRQFTAKGDYFWQNFVFTGGLEREWSDFLNLFRAGSYGLVAFRNLNDFLNDTNGVISRNYVDPSVRPMADISEFGTNSAFGQAKWNVNDRLNFTFGVRLDIADAGIKPALNQAFLTATGFRNDGSLDGVKTISPRIGFNYSPDSERKTQLRGGIGHFLGRSPWVFFSNSFGNTGVGTFSRASNDTANPLSSSFATYLQSFDPANPIGTGTDNPNLRREVDFNDDGLDLPAVWRGNLAIDRKLPFLDSTFTAEFVYSDVSAGLRTTNENLKPLAGGLALDGRARFSGAPSTQANARYTGYTNMYRVSNANVGKSAYFSLQWDRPLKNNWAFNLAYTRGRATEAQANGQTTAGGQFNRNVIFNQNTIEVGTADFEIKDRVQLSLTRQFEFIKKFKTTVSLYYEGRSGSPYSWVFSGDLNGDGVSFNDAVVVPTGPTDARFDFSGMTSAQQTAFFAYLDKSGLSKYAGQPYVPKNTFYEPWVNRLDLNFKQDIPLHGSIKAQLFFDFINFGSFISKSTFGYTEALLFPNQQNDVFRTRTLTTGTSYNNATGQIKPLFAADPANITIDNQQSRWRIQVGAKLLF
ncbi:MAG TPA: carboxypeptidase regulatory-like domain-containing protein [Lacunisphaera sp.]